MFLSSLETYNRHCAVGMAAEGFAYKGLYKMLLGLNTCVKQVLTTAVPIGA